MHRLALLFAVLALAVASACGGDDGDGGGEQTGADGGAAAQTIQVSAVDFAFEPAELTADPGAIEIELTNDGQAPHALEVEGNGVEESSDTIDPGASTTLALDLEEGTYEIYCPVGNHADMGMVGTLTVGSGGSGAGATDTGGDGETETEDSDTGETETGETETGATGTGAPGY